MRMNVEKMRLELYRKGLNQRDVARLSGVSYVTINGIFNGRATSEATATRIADSLGVPLGAIKEQGAR